MRYAQSSQSFRQHKPKKGFLSFLKKDKQRRRIVVQKEDGYHRYANPLKAKIQKKIGLAHIAPISLATITFVWVGLMLYLPYFRITAVNYTGLKIIKTEEVSALINKEFLSPSRWWPSNNFFLVHETSVVTALEKAFPLNSVEVIKIFPNTLTINMEESISSAIYDNGSQYWLLDQEGMAIKYLREVNTTTEFQLSKVTLAAPATTTTVLGAKITASSTPQTTSTLVHVPNFGKIRQEYGNYPLIYDTRNIPAIDRQNNVLAETLIGGVIDFFNGLERAGIAKTKYITLGEPGAGATIITDHPWKIIFQPANNADAQLENLKIVLRDNRPAEYVDVRFGERIYWK